MSAILYKPSDKTSADNETAVEFSDVPEDCTNHLLIVDTTGEVAVGTASIKCDGAVLSGAIDLTTGDSVGKKITDTPCSTITITPLSMTEGTTFTVRLRSW